MPLFLIALATFCATLAGGFLALYLKDKLHLILGFSAGAVIGVAFFNLLPEAVEFGIADYEPHTLMLWVATGFVFYLLLDRGLSLHRALGTQDLCDHPDHHSAHRHGGHHHATLGASSISLHSFFDGLAIGLAFKVSPSVGFIMAIAVLTHGFSDGMNTMNMVLKNQGSARLGLRWLAVNAAAPTLGLLAASFMSISPSQFGVALAIFAGLFLYIGASDLIPESFHNHPKALTTVMTLLGMATIYFAISFSH